MPAYIIPTHNAIFIAPDSGDVLSNWAAWTGQPAPAGLWLELQSHVPLTILRYDEPPNTCEPDLPAGAITDPSAPCLTITAPVGAWAAWAGHGLLTHAVPGEGWFTQP